MSTTVAPTPAPSRIASAAAAARSLPMRAIAFFSGTVGFAVKIGLLAVTNAIAVWAATVLISKAKSVPAGSYSPGN